MIWTDWQAYDHYAYAAIAAGGTFVAVVLVWWLMVRSPWTGWVRSLKGVVPPFINIIGVLFGLTLAFLANDTWTAHDRAINAVLREADSIQSLSVLSAGLSPGRGDEMRGAVADYVRDDVAEWPLLAHERTDPAVDRDANRLLSLVADRAVAEAVGTTVQRVMLEHVASIRANRSIRIELSQTHVNPLKWLGMAFLGLLTLLSVAVVHADNTRAAMTGIILFALAGAPTSAIVLIHGNPFQQPSAVSPAPIVNALARP